MVAFSKVAGPLSSTNKSILEQSTVYYFFGELFENNNVSKNRYLYNGKEQQDQVIGGMAFGWYDYGARFYDTEIGRWHSVDPLAEKYAATLPYAYVANFIDPDGKAIRPAYSESFDILLLSLPAEARSIITMNKSGFIDASSVDAAFSKFGSSGNLHALREIVLDERIVDFDATAIKYDYINAKAGENGTFEFQEPIRRNVYQEMLNEFMGTPQEKQQYAQHLISMGILDETDVSGNLGAALRPANAQQPYTGGQISKTDNFQVFVSPVGTTPTENVKNVGHELFGHLYFWFKGKDSRHESPTSNPLLDRQIIDREQESAINSQY